MGRFVEFISPMKKFKLYLLRLKNNNEEIIYGDY